MNFVLTGRCPGHERADLITEMRHVGWTVQDRVTSGTRVLVASQLASDGGTSKMNAARQHGCEIWTYTRLLRQLRLARGEADVSQSTPELVRRTTSRLQAVNFAPYGSTERPNAAQRAEAAVAADDLRLATLRATTEQRRPQPQQAVRQGSDLRMQASFSPPEPAFREPRRRAMVEAEWRTFGSSSIDDHGREMDDPIYGWLQSCERRFNITILWRREGGEYEYAYREHLSDEQTQPLTLTALSSQMRDRAREWREGSATPPRPDFQPRKLRRTL